MLEPYRARFFVDDELIVDCELTLDPYHKGIERIMEGMPVEKASLSPKEFAVYVRTYIFGTALELLKEA